ncbi:MAG: FHA domain-containing protein [Eubacterium sp.]|nr:FHA domain-containing protein [Eubacterium sp.]
MKIKLYANDRSEYFDLDSFGKDVISFGRNPESDIKIPGECDYVSRNHGCFYKKDGKWYIHDLESRHGIKMGNKLIEDHVLDGGTFIIEPKSGGTSKVRIVASGDSFPYKTGGEEPFVKKQEPYKSRIEEDDNTVSADSINNIGDSCEPGGGLISLLKRTGSIIIHPVTQVKRCASLNGIKEPLIMELSIFISLGVVLLILFSVIGIKYGDYGDTVDVLYKTYNRVLFYLFFSIIIVDVAIVVAMMITERGFFSQNNFSFQKALSVIGIKSFITAIGIPSLLLYLFVLPDSLYDLGMNYDAINNMYKSIGTVVLIVNSVSEIYGCVSMVQGYNALSELDDDRKAKSLLSIVLFATLIIAVIVYTFVQNS